MKCSECKHWVPNKELNKCFLEEDHIGFCEEIAVVLEITLKTGWDGGYVESIETGQDFFCASFENKP